MDAIGMISYNGRGADNVCFSLPGVLTAVPVRFSLPAPDLFFDSGFSGSPGIYTELQFIQDRIGHFFVSVAGLFRTVHKRIRTALPFCQHEISVLRTRTLKLSYAGRRL